jgi:hypothetical protein
MHGKTRPKRVPVFLYVAGGGLTCVIIFMFGLLYLEGDKHNKFQKAYAEQTDHLRISNAGKDFHKFSNANGWLIEVQ